MYRKRNNDDEWIYGIHAVEEALAAGRQIEKIYIRRDSGGEPIRKLTQLARDHVVPVSRVPVQKLNQLVKGNHQGVIALLPALEYQPLEELILRLQEAGETPALLMLDGVSDVRNFGAIARSAEAMGMHGIIVPAEGSASANADAVRVSVGALHHIPVSRVRMLLNTVELLKAYGIAIVAMSEKAEQELSEADLKGPVCLLMGAEDKGISPQLLKKADVITAIPLTGKISSLNVSVAAGIAVYELRRQRG